MMAPKCAQCGGDDFDVGDTSLQRICTSCGVVSTDQSATCGSSVQVEVPINEDVDGTHYLQSPESNSLQKLSGHKTDDSVETVCEREVTQSSNSKKKCKQCGESEFDIGDLSNGYQSVCLNCGTVDTDESGNITHEDGLAEYVSLKHGDYHCRGNLPSHYGQHSDSKRIPRGTAIALKKFSMFSQQLDLPKHVHQDGESVVSQALDKFSSTKQESKNKLAAACVYLACRRHDQPITIDDIANLVEGCTKYDIMANFNMVRTALNINVEHRTFTQVAEAEINKFSGELKKETLDKMYQLIELLESFSVTDGRRPRVVIIVAICLVLQASERPKLDLVKFAKEHGIKELTNCKTRYKEILNVLCTVAKKVPWLAGQKLDGKNKKVLLYLNDILSYRRSFKFDVSGKSDESASSKTATESISANSAARVPSKTQTSNVTASPRSAPELTEIQNTKEESNRKSEEKVKPNAIKRKINHGCDWVGKYPPCFRRGQEKPGEEAPKRVRVENIVYDSNLDKTELDENDLSDSELNLYLRSEKEVAFCKTFLNQ